LKSFEPASGGILSKNFVMCGPCTNALSPSIFFLVQCGKERMKKKTKEKDYLENPQFGLSLYFIVLKE
jgi:hypothetical protein